jgi:hypothetical protein
VNVQAAGIDATDREGVQSIGDALKRAGFTGEAMTRSLEQNDCLHKWCRVIKQHLRKNGANLTEETVKELILNGLGNTREIKVPGMEPQKVAMRSSKYKQLDSDLTPAEQRAGFISMNELLNRVEAWAATDLGLDLTTENNDEA